MTLAELSTPFEKHRIIQFAADGNTPVRHWYEMQRIVGSLYRGRDIEDEYDGTVCNLFLVFDGVKDGLFFRRRPIQPALYTVEQCAEVLAKNDYDTLDGFLASLDRYIEQSYYIDKVQIEFARQVDGKRAERYARHRARLVEEQKREEQEERDRLKAEQLKEEQRRKAEADAERAKLLGWADKMTPMRYGRVKAHLDVLINQDGEVMTRRDFVISRVADGWLPKQWDVEVTPRYEDVWNTEQRKTKTEYGLCKDNICYEVSKTEHDFAVYLISSKVPA